MNSIFSKMVLFMSVLVLVACSNGNGGGGNLADNKIGPNPQNFCSNVATTDAIQVFHSSQTQYRIRGTGFNVDCVVDENINGQVTHVEKHGYSSVEVLPNLKFLDVKLDLSSHLYVIRVEAQFPQEQDQRQILAKLGYQLGANDALPIENGLRNFPSYVRMGRGLLYYINQHDMKLVADGKYEMRLIPSPEQGDESAYSAAMGQFANTQQGLEILWSPDSQILSRQILGITQSREIWSQLDAHDVLRSMVREASTVASRGILVRAIDQANWWNLNYAKVHQLLPELYSFADSEWKNPRFEQSEIKGLFSELKYLNLVNSAHPLKPVYETYNRIQRYFGTSQEALQTSYQYFKGQGWNQPQFEQLIHLSELLYTGVGSNSWSYAVAIAKKTNFDTQASAEFEDLTGQLMARNIVQKGSADETILAVSNKMNQGLSVKNKDYYFRLYDLFQSQYKAWGKQNEYACDEFVLRGLVPESGLSIVTNYLQWLKNDQHLDFLESIQSAITILKANGLSAAAFDLVKVVFIWLKDTVYLSRTDALSMSQRLVIVTGFDQARFTLFQDYFTWLKDTLYLNRTEALTKTENAVVTNQLSVDVLKALRELTDWFVNTIYFNRTEALSRSENLILKQKIGSIQADLLKSIVNWLVNTLYLNRNDAVQKGENYIVGAVRMTPAIFQQFQKLTDWYTNTMYVNRTEALTHSENLVLTNGLIAEQTNLVMESADWLVNSLYISKSEAIAKGEMYLLKVKMNRRQFDQLKQICDRLINQGKSRSEALKQAEAEALRI